MRRIGLILTLVAGAGWIAGCPGSIDDPGRFVQDGGVTGDGGVVDCTALATALLSDNSATGCARLGCHASSAPTGSLDLLSPDLVTRLSRSSTTAACSGLFLINMEQPRESLLYSKLTSAPPCGSKMPLGGDLTPTQVECVGVWLDSLAAPVDAGVDEDTGVAMDAGNTGDTGAEIDAGQVDTGPIDTGPADTGPVDTGPVPVDVTVQAEDGSFQAPFETRGSTAAQGNTYLIVPRGVAINPDPDAMGVGRAQYTFQVDSDNTVTVWLRARALDFGSDSIWVIMDGGAATRFNDVNAANYDEWRWDQVHDSDAMDAIMQYTLTPGQHTLEVVRREPDLRLDAILITSDPNFDPNN